MGHWVGLPRCGLVLRVGPRAATHLCPGDYPCTAPEGHDGPHVAVIRWLTPAQAKAAETAARAR